MKTTSSCSRTRVFVNRGVLLCINLVLVLGMLTSGCLPSPDNKGEPGESHAQDTRDNAGNLPDTGQNQPSAPTNPGTAEPARESSSSLQAADSILKSAFDNRRTGFQVQGQGVVTRLLSDDVEGSRHQRFILRLGTGQTLLISHNIDLAPRIGGLAVGDTVTFHGEYEWNEKGGVIHWTHHDPEGRHVGGWLKHNGRLYE